MLPTVGRRGPFPSPPGANVCGHPPRASGDREVGDHARARARLQQLAVAVGICLPIPLLAATGLSIPLPNSVERLAAALVPWAGPATFDSALETSVGKSESIIHRRVSVERNERAPGQPRTAIVHARPAHKTAARPTPTAVP
jgi:hypothetical protein